MITQLAITNSVIDRGLRFPHILGMLTADEIREELIRQLDEEKLVAAHVARVLNIAPARVTEMRNRTRRVQQNEMRPLAELLGMIHPVRGATRSVDASESIPHVGKVAAGVWLEESPFDPENEDRESVPYDRIAGDPPPTDLFAVTLEGPSMNVAWPKPNTRLICRRVPFGFIDLKSGDYAIVVRTAHDLHELTCKRVEIDENGVFWLHSESTDDRYKEPWRVGRPDENYHGDIEVRVIAKVVRAVQVYE